MIVTEKLRDLIESLEQAAVDWQDAQQQASSVRHLADHELNRARRTLIEALEALP